VPWDPSDATKKTSRADTAEKRRQWAHVANEELARTGDDARAIRAANSVIKHHPAGKPKPTHWSKH